MSVFSTVSNATATGTQVYTLTGRGEDSLTAAGYSAFVQSVTGAAPVVVKAADGSVKMVLTQEQVRTMQKWIDDSIIGALTMRQPPATAKDGKPGFSLNTNPVLTPLLMKYLLITGGVFFLSGFFIRGVVR